MKHFELVARARKVAEVIREFQPLPWTLYGLRPGGVPAAYLIASVLPSDSVMIVDDPSKATVFIADALNTGESMREICDAYPGIPFFCLVDHQQEPNLPWVTFPWQEKEGGVESHIKQIIRHIGDVPERQGLVETPRRVAKAWKEWGGGYSQDPAKVLKVFEDGAENYDQMVIVKDIPFYSMCEHHMAAIFGTATIAYVPQSKIVGLSKLSRVLDIFARRLQVQERLTNQVAEAINVNLTPRGVGVVIKARHLCMESRGICKQGHQTVTSALLGCFRNEPETRAEFLRLAGA